MDYVIEPGDVARDADTGPTKTRLEALVTTPVSLYRQSKALNREDACNLLGLDPSKPAVLVQMGVGSQDLDQRVSAVIRGLSGWPDLQIVMPREPKDANGNSLIPENMSVKIVRYFPLADVLHAFDAAVCAAGYNSVHEVIPAAIPTLLIANNRGTDNQFARAKWCADSKLTLFADNESLAIIESQAGRLKNSALREELSQNCRKVHSFDGADQISEILTFFLHERYSSLMFKTFHYQRFFFINLFARNPRFYLKRIVNFSLRTLLVVFRYIRPHNDLLLPKSEVIFSQSREFRGLEKYIRNQEKFEHLLENASETYISNRNGIAQSAYGEITAKVVEAKENKAKSFKIAS
jgi:hypothetical protein